MNCKYFCPTASDPEIEAERLKMYELAEKYGWCDTRVLKQSQKLDNYIVEHYRIQEQRMANEMAGAPGGAVVIV